MTCSRYVTFNDTYEPDNTHCFEVIAMVTFRERADLGKYATCCIMIEIQSYLQPLLVASIQSQPISP